MSRWENKGSCFLFKLLPTVSVKIGLTPDFDRCWHKVGQHWLTLTLPLCVWFEYTTAPGLTPRRREINLELSLKITSLKAWWGSSKRIGLTTEQEFWCIWHGYYDWSWIWRFELLQIMTRCILLKFSHKTNQFDSGQVWTLMGPTSPIASPIVDQFRPM